MEREGLRRSLEFLQDNDVEVTTLVTDRHPSVNKFLSEQWPNIEHFFDVWHASKGLLIFYFLINNWLEEIAYSLLYIMDV